MKLAILLAALALTVPPVAALAAQSTPADSRPARSGPAYDESLVIRGHVACLDKANNPIPSTQSCPAEGARYLFTGLDGKTYTFLPDDPLTAMFSDTRVRVRLLQLTAQQHEGNKIELVTVQSVKDGKLYDIYYYCETCNITLYAPGPCPCCRKELEFKEAPADQP
ncbi:MAG TPA: hypothetical protein VEZ90_15130 [Blastocatellia bacterium]|nr:hypothetical protein [Blastocatellia bacterium]